MLTTSCDLSLYVHQSYLYSKLHTGTSGTPNRAYWMQHEHATEILISLCHVASLEKRSTIKQKHPNLSLLWNIKHECQGTTCLDHLQKPIPLNTKGRTAMGIIMWCVWCLTSISFSFIAYCFREAIKSSLTNRWTTNRQWTTQSWNKIRLRWKWKHLKNFEKQKSNNQFIEALDYWLKFIVTINLTFI